jgi:hypothetical protein
MSSLAADISRDNSVCSFHMIWDDLKINSQTEKGALALPTSRRAEVS